MKSWPLVGATTELLLVKFREVFFAPFPLRVVMRITPFAALDPYTEADVASFNTEMDSTSLRLILLISTSGIPSTTINGLALLTVPRPLMIRLASLFPAIPEDCTACKPGTRPVKAEETFGKARLTIFSSTLTCETAPTRFTFF